MYHFSLFSSLNFTLSLQLILTMSPRTFGSDITNTVTPKPYVERVPELFEQVFTENIDPIAQAAREAAVAAAAAAREAELQRQQADPDFMFAYTIPDESSYQDLLDNLDNVSLHSWGPVDEDDIWRVEMPSDSELQRAELMELLDDALDARDGAWARLLEAEDRESISSEDLNAVHHQYSATCQVHVDAHNNLLAFLSLNDVDVNNNNYPHHVVIETPPASPDPELSLCAECNQLDSPAWETVCQNLPTTALFTPIDPLRCAYCTFRETFISMME
jgi:hypothetical protein